MIYVIFDKNTTQFVRIMRDGYWQDAHFKNEAAAKAGLTRLKKAGKFEPEMVIDTIENFFKVEKTMKVRNLMTGKIVTISVNTPRCCDPSTELYWSM